MQTKTIVGNRQKNLEMGSNDVVMNGGLEKDTPCASVLVTAQSDLAELPAYPAGTIAYTAGFKAMWQLSAAGDWVSVL